MTSKFQATRRETLAAFFGSIVAGAATAYPRGVAAATRPQAVAGTLDPLDPNDFPLVSQKMIHRADDGMSYAWLTATKYALVGTTLTPLHSMESGAISRTKITSDGYEVTTLERTFYTGYRTNKLLDKWRNPLTGETIALTRGPVGPTTTKYDHDGALVIPETYLGLQFNASSETSLASVNGDDIWIQLDSNAQVFRNGPEKPPFRVTELRTLQAKLSEVIDPEITVVEAQLGLHEVNSWPAAMNMGDLDGAVIIRGFGRKVLDFQQMPTSWGAKLARINPEIAADPIAALDRPAAEFEQ